MLQHKFVESIPAEIEANVIYISIPFCTAIHLCVCGCGKEVVTPLSPTDWQLHFDGKTISLSPSIGNWSFECQSHYFIRRNKIEYSMKWTDKEIEKGRDRDSAHKEHYYANSERTQQTATPRKKKWWKWLRKKK